MVEWMKGKKTYLVMVASIIGGIVLIMEGSVEAGITAILAALGLGSLRAGVAKAGNGN